MAIFGQGFASLGLKAGVSIANQSYRISPIDYALETDPVVGPALSIFVEAFRGDHFSFQADISYAVKGSKSATQSLTVNHLDNDRIIVNEGAVATSTFSYLSLEPMARFRVGQGSLVPYFLLGPRVDILLKYQSGSEYPLVDQNSIILGLTCGAGLEFKLQRLGLFTELKYLPDIGPVTSKEPLLINNNMLSLTLGIRRIGSE
jgi:hypothetical protein